MIYPFTFCCWGHRRVNVRSAAAVYLRLTPKSDRWIVSHLLVFSAKVTHQLMLQSKGEPCPECLPLCRMYNASPLDCSIRCNFNYHRSTCVFSEPAFTVVSAICGVLGFSSWLMMKNKRFPKHRRPQTPRPANL